MICLGCVPVSSQSGARRWSVCLVLKDVGVIIRVGSLQLQLEVVKRIPVVSFS
jgi:hypothetical protein